MSEPKERISQRVITGLALLALLAATCGLVSVVVADMDSVEKNAAETTTSSREEPLTMCQEYCVEKKQCMSHANDSWANSRCHQCRALCRIEGLLTIEYMEKEKENEKPPTP